MAAEKQKCQPTVSNFTMNFCIWMILRSSWTRRMKKTNRRTWPNQAKNKCQSNNVNHHCSNKFLATKEYTSYLVSFILHSDFRWMKITKPACSITS